MEIPAKNFFFKSMVMALLVSAFLFGPGMIFAELNLPQTPCDHMLSLLPHLSSSMTLEDGETAFTYGADNNNFVSQSGNILTFRIPILFTELRPSWAIIKLLALDANCFQITGFGAAFTNLDTENENILTYDTLSNTVKLNGATNRQFPNGIPRYVWVEAWDGFPGSSFASYSYLIDINDPQNPTGQVGEPTEPLGPRPVLIVPGIAGTDLFDNGEFIWPDAFRMAGDINDNFLTEHLSLNKYGSSIKLIDTGDIVRSIDAGLKEINILTGLIFDLSDSVYIEEKSLFTFPYDWRLDLDQTKLLLQQEVEAIKTLTGFDKVDVIAHSMGGVLVKDYLDDFGEDSINKLIFVGTPHLGAPKAAKVLLQGDRFDIPWLEEDRIQEIAQNSSSVYQLLPSQKYFDEFSGYISTPSLLDYLETKSFLIDKGINSFLFSRAEDLFGKNLAEMNFGSIDSYNIAGCGRATQAGYRYGFNGQNISSIGYTSGDKTVPLASADYVNTPNKYYAKNGSHAELPSANGVRELILGILSGSPELADNISTSQSFCNFQGKTLTWRSPVEVHIYDEQGNHAGPIENNGLENNILGVEYEVIDGEKFIFLPTDEGQNYTIEGLGEADGSFDLLVSNLDNGSVIETKVFNDIAITDSSVVNFDVSDSTADDTIEFDYEGNGQTEIINADAVLDQSQSEDVAPPTTEASLEGTVGNNGWYRSSVMLTLNASDENSGILTTLYSLDGGQAFDLYENPFQIEQDGLTDLRYYSVDRAGNNELVKSLEIKIDKTPPEFMIEFDLGLQDFVISSTDDIDTSPQISCSETSCLAEDQAGNTAELAFEEKGKKKDKIFLLFITYNDQPPIEFPNSRFVVAYKEKKDTLKDFDQSIVIKKQERARVNYQRKKDRSIVTVGIKGEKKSKESFRGFKLLQLKTSQGMLDITIK